MKKIIEARKLLGVEKTAELKDLKTIYRTFMKDWHPDKIQNDEEKKLQAEEKSKAFIEAYHLLVSVAPKRMLRNLSDIRSQLRTPEWSIFIQGPDACHKFLNGSSYEYFGVPKNIYLKLVNSATPDRFLRRHVYHSFVYRKVSKAVDQN